MTAESHKVGDITQVEECPEQPRALSKLTQQCLWHSQQEGREKMKGSFAGVKGRGQLWLGESGRN